MGGYETVEVTFDSGGSPLSGVLYRPRERPEGCPCVVMAHGFSGTMDWILPDFAADFAGAGLAVLLFDYRHFGTSPGQPRQLLDTRLQLEDLRNALAYARSREDLDGRRIALWGTSLGGSHVIDLAAADPAVAAVVANVPALDMYAGLRGRYRPPHFRPGPVATAVATARLMAAATVDTVAGALRLPPHYLPVYGALGRAAFSDPALADQFRQVQHSAASWRNEFTPRFLFHAPRYRAGTVERIGCPLLVTLARDDAQLSTPFVLQKISRARHAEVRLYPVGHFDMYHGIVREEVAHDHREFLLRWLEPT